MAQSLQVMPDELWETVNRIEGWLTKDEANQLYQFCSGTWCEIGSWKGRSTTVLAAKSHGYAVDWFKGNLETKGADTLDEFNKNTANLNITVLPERMETAIKKIKEPIQFLFLDGEHTYEATKLAFELYAPLVIKGGYIVIHDVHGYMGEKVSYPGVTRFGEELLNDKHYKHVGDANRSMAVQKL